MMAVFTVALMLPFPTFVSGVLKDSSTCGENHMGIISGIRR